MDDKKEWTEQDEAEAARIDAEPEPDDDELERAISEAIAERDAEE